MVQSTRVAFYNNVQKDPHVKTSWQEDQSLNVSVVMSTKHKQQEVRILKPSSS